MYVSLNTIASNDGNVILAAYRNSIVVLCQRQGAPPERVSPKQCLRFYFGGFTHDETRF